MGEYIKREAAVKAVEKYGLTNGVVWGRHTGLAICIASEIAEIPAADVAPVVHARWVSVAGKRDRICSRCLHNEPYKNADDDAEVFEFCPHCGAKMDGGDSNAKSV